MRWWARRLMVTEVPPRAVIVHSGGAPGEPGRATGCPARTICHFSTGS